MADDTQASGGNDSGDGGFVPETLDTGDSGTYDIRSMQKYSMEGEPEPELEGDKIPDEEFEVEPYESDKEEDGESETLEGGDESADRDDEDEAPDTEESEDYESESESESEKREAAKAEDKDEYFQVELNGKKVDIPKDAEFPVKIDGKIENVPLSEALADYSGRTALSRGHADLGRERKQIKEIKDQMIKTNQDIMTNVQALSEMDDPVEFCEYFAELNGGDPEEILANMVDKTVKFIQEYKTMTPKEREQARELRRYKRQEKQKTAAEAVAKQNQEQEAEKARISQRLEEEGLSIDDWDETLAIMQKKLEAGEELGYGFDEIQDIQPDDVVDYAVVMDLENRVNDAATKVERQLQAKKGSLVDDNEFLSKIAVALNKIEQLHGRQKPEEVVEFIKDAVERDNTSLKERLSKKAQKRAASERSNSKRDEDDDGESFASIDELLEARRQQMF